MRLQLVFEDPRTRVKKAKEWLEMQEQSEDSDPLVKARRIFNLIEALSLMRKQ